MILCLYYKQNNRQTKKYVFSNIALKEKYNVCSKDNYVSNYVFQTHNLKQFALNKVLYSGLRDRFNLKSQMTQSVLKTVIARYKTILENQCEWIKPNFKKPQYDLVWNGDYSLMGNYFSVITDVPDISQSLKYTFIKQQGWFLPVDGPLMPA